MKARTVFEHVGVVPAGLLVVGIQAVQVGARRRDLGHRPHHGIEGRRHRRVARQRQRAEGAAVIAGIAGDDLPALGLAHRERVLARQLYGAFHRFRSARDEEDLLHAARRQGGGLLGQPFGRLGFEVQAVAEGGFLHLPAHRLEHALVGMADVADHGAGRAVEIALAVDVPHIDAPRLVERRPTPPGLVEKVAFLAFGHQASTGKAAQSRGRMRTETRAPSAKGCSSIMLIA